MRAATVVLALAIGPAWAQVAQKVAAIAPREAKPCARVTGPRLTPSRLAMGPSSSTTPLGRPPRVVSYEPATADVV